MKKNILILAVFIIFFSLAFFLFAKDEITAESAVYINNKKISVETASTPEEKFKGLSNRNNLCDDCGMLFIFQDKAERTFVMRDMLFPLDIIWINGEKIVRIDKGLQPDNEKPLIKHKSGVPVDYVLEVNAGFSEINNLKIGDNVKINIKK